MRSLLLWPSTTAWYAGRFKEGDLELFVLTWKQSSACFMSKANRSVVHVGELHVKEEDDGSLSAVVDGFYETDIAPESVDWRSLIVNIVATDGTNSVPYSSSHVPPLSRSRYEAASSSETCGGMEWWATVLIVVFSLIAVSLLVVGAAYGGFRVGRSGDTYEPL